MMKKQIKNLIIIFIIVLMFIGMCFVPINASKLIPILEEQVSKDLGVNVHVEKLVLRTGPHIKIKAPTMHVMYNDGQKFAQFDNVKFFIPWSILFKERVVISKVIANKLTVRVNSDDKKLSELIERLNSQKVKDSPNISLKSYNFSYKNHENNDVYSIVGNNLTLNKLKKFESFHLKSIGDFLINDVKYCNYDINILPKINRKELKSHVDIIEIVEQLKASDFHADIVADVKLYKNNSENLESSGFINIDNISVFDKARKNPKSFIYLTLWGNKASIISNIYTSQSQKVSLEGMVNNSKNPVVDLKVKAEEINLADLYSKMKIFMDLSHLKNLSISKGSLNANFSLKGDLNRIKSSGYLKIANAVAYVNGVKIDKINSDMDFSNNKIFINNTMGYVNNAPIHIKGNIEKEADLEILMNNVELQHLIPSCYGVKKGIISLAAKIQGPLNKISHKENVQISDFLLQKDDITFNFNSLKYDTNKNDEIIVNDLRVQTPYTNEIKLPTSKLTYSGGALALPETNVFMQNSKLVLKADISNFSNLSFNVLLKGFVSSRDVLALNKNSDIYPLKFIYSGNKQCQNLITQVLIEKTDVFDEPLILNLMSKIEKNAIKLEDLSLITLNGKFSEDYRANIKGQKKAIITGLLEDFTGKLKLKNVRIFIPQQLNLKFKDTLAQIKGDIFVSGKISSPDIVGQVLIQNLFNQTSQLSLTNATCDFNKNNIIINAPIAKFSDISMSLNALASTDFTKEIFIKNINIKSKYLDTNTLLMYKDSPLMKIYPYTIKEGKLFVERLIADVYSSPISITAFSSDFTIKDNLLKMKNIKAELLNGKMEGEVEYNLRDEHFGTKLMVRGVSAEPVFNIVSTRKDSISGVVDTDLVLDGNLSSKKSLNGNIKLIVNNGRMSTLGKLEHLLYAQNVIADNLLRTSLSVVIKAITLKDTGLFKYMKGDISLVNGVADIKFLQTQGPHMSLFIKGQYETISDYANLIILGRLSDEILTGLGAFGDFSINKLMIMLTGEDSKTQILPDDYEKIPSLPVKNTKEFCSIINGIIDKPASVKSFNWISYSEKEYKHKEIPVENTTLPDFVRDLPY